MLHVGMIAVRYVDVSPAAQSAFIAMIEELNPMQIVQVPHGGSMLAIDLERVQRLVPARIAGGLECRERAVAKSTLRNALASSIRTGCNFAGQGMFALFDECLGHGGDFGDGTIQPERRIDGVRQQIARDSAARH